MKYTIYCYSTMTYIQLNVHMLGGTSAQMFF